MSRLAFLICCISLAVVLGEANAQDAVNKINFEPFKHPKDAKTHKVFQQQVQFSLYKTPLNKALELISEKVELEFFIDQKALDDIGLSPDTPVTFSITESASLYLTLKLMLDQVKLTFTLDQGMVVITTEERIEDEYHYTKYYNFASIQSLPNVSLEELHKIVLNHFEPQSWTKLGGKASGHPVSSGLVINQSYHNHRKIARFFEQYCYLTQQDNRKDGDSIKLATYYPHNSLKLSQSLNTQVKEINFKKEPLHSALLQLSKEAKLPLLIDLRGFDEVGLSESSPLTSSLEADHLVRTVIRRLIKPLDLVALNYENLLIITTDDRKELFVDTRLYPISDFPLDTKAEQEQWFNLLTDNIETEEWEELGRHGTCSLDIATKSLIVSQSSDIHEKITALIQQIRQHTNPSATPVSTTALNTQQNVIVIQDGKAPPIIKGRNPQPSGNPFGDNLVPSDPFGGNPIK